MRVATEAKVDAVMDEPFALHSLANAHFDKQISRVLFEEAGANALLTILAAARLEDDGIDTFEIQQVAEHEPGGTSSHNADLTAHMIHISKMCGYPAGTAAPARKSRIAAVNCGAASIFDKCAVSNSR